MLLPNDTKPYFNVRLSTNATTENKKILKFLVLKHLMDKDSNSITHSLIHLQLTFVPPRGH